MAGWNHQCNGHELGQASGDSEGQGGLAGCSPWSRKELDMTGQRNNNKHILKYSLEDRSYSIQLFPNGTQTVVCDLEDGDRNAARSGKNVLGGK